MISVHSLIKLSNLLFYFKSRGGNIFISSTFYERIEIDILHYSSSYKRVLQVKSPSKNVNQFFIINFVYNAKTMLWIHFNFRIQFSSVVVISFSNSSDSSSIPTEKEQKRQNSPLMHHSAYH